MPETARPWLTWATRLIALASVGVPAWACLTQWGAVTHGHPAYAVLLAVSAVGGAIQLWRWRRPRDVRGGWRYGGRVVLVVLAAVWAALLWWLIPFTAQQPALAAMNSDGLVTVQESPTQIVMTPTDAPSDLGLFFQPGAKVEARAYAAHLRPLAESGYTVVIPKQPLGIAFLALPAFDSARPQFPEVSQWVVGGHSLGGTVAAMEADAGDQDATAPAVGLMFFASYPAGDISGSLTASVASISGSQDGLSTPAKIDASRADLPADALFTQVEGANHAQFGAYGPQPGDGVATISDDDARQQISAAALAFMNSLTHLP